MSPQGGRGWWGVTIAALAVAVAAVAAGAAPVASDADARDTGRQVDVVVALRSGGRCGPLQDTLPTLVAATGLQPGTRTDPVVVCVANRGKRAARLTLAVIEMVQSELQCTGDEGVVDSSCGGGGEGELAANLQVVLAVQPGCGGPLGSAMTVPFSRLVGHPEPLAGIGSTGRTDCVSLALAYLPTSDVAAAAAQTDQVSWRYAFDLTT